MKGRTDDASCSFAHALVARSAAMSRCSPSARGSRASRARCVSSAASRRCRPPPDLVSDWDGGTRDRRRAAGVPRRYRASRLCARRALSSSSPTDSSAAIRRRLRDAVAEIVAARLAPELADAARRRSRLAAADRGAGSRSAASSMIWSTAGRPPRSSSHVLSLDKGRPRDRTRRCPSSHLASGRPAAG